MLIMLGILLLVAGASVTFAVDRELDGVDVQLAGWILLAGGALALILAMIRAAALGSTASDGGAEVRPPDTVPGVERPHQPLHRLDREASESPNQADGDGRRAA